MANHKQLDQQMHPPAEKITPEVVFFDLGDTLISASGHWVAGAKAVLQMLSASGFRTGVISNTGNLDRNQLLDHLPADFSWDIFSSELILLSAEVGHEKPDLEIFYTALHRSNTSGNRCIFCTEDLEHILAAQSIGLNAVRIGSDPAADLKLIAEYLCQTIPQSVHTEFAFSKTGSGLVKKLI